MAADRLNQDFVELNRTFHELSKVDLVSDELDIGPNQRLGTQRKWPDLLQEYRVVILSEAGSGKTAEIRNIARVLRSEGKHAFFLRIENIPTNFDVAFEVGSSESFSQWITSNDEGWLLLDSIDEARLKNPGDFELAIRKLGKQISGAKERAHILVSGRTTAWRPKSDLAICVAHLPFASAQTEVLDSNDDSQFLTTSHSADTEPGSAFKIVTLDDLSQTQIAAFVDAKGVEDAKAFLDAVERADAWTFTTRPQDLTELVEFWKDNSRIGTRLEFMRNSIERRLSERDQDRAEARPISAERIREGARLLAAAATLTQEQTIRVPDGTDSASGVAIRSVLPHWNDKDHLTLLSRPIFDEEIYGSVRFHHRSVREYLTAEWFADLLKKDTSRGRVENLFFKRQYGMDVVVPILRPILPWLSILDEKIRARVQNTAPEIFFEGGDPVHLPQVVRKSVLIQACEQIEKGAVGHSFQDYASIERFSNEDLAETIRALLKAAKGNEELQAFLLRMVWIGKITAAAPEVLKIVRKSSIDNYTRRVAFRAILAVGSREDNQLVRDNFLSGPGPLNRDSLAELIDNVSPDAETWDWLLSCLKKCAPEKPHSLDHLGDELLAFVDGASSNLLPKMALGLNDLLNAPPFLEKRFCEISKRYQWVLVAAAKCVERLVALRDPASMTIEVLSILHKVSSARGYAGHDLSEIKADFNKLVVEWPDLNRALFWYETRQARAVADRKRGERLVDFWQVSIFGSFWKFSDSDFFYFSEQLSERTLLDDQLVALSAAFHLYKESKRPIAWRKLLKQRTRSSTDLAARLHLLMKPSPRSADSRRFQRLQSTWKRRDAARQRKEDKHHADWKIYLANNLEKMKMAVDDHPGKVTNSVYYLYSRTRDHKSSSGRWTDDNWRALIPDFGETTARFYRDAAVKSWRRYEPKLRSEGAPLNETQLAVIIGLTGLEIEAAELANWPASLTDAEVMLACKYASFELNGFPTWFPKLFESHRRIVSAFLLQEIQFELSIETPESETHYIISDIAWSGQWIWEEIGQDIYNLLWDKDPQHLSTLDKLLKILLGSAIPDHAIERIAEKKCRDADSIDHRARWLAVWTGINPDSSIPRLQEQLEAISPPELKTFFAMKFVTHLLGGRRGGGGIARRRFNTPSHLKSIYLLMHRYIRYQDDIDRAGAGVYSPQLRDDAQDARNTLFELLNALPGKEAFTALVDIAELHPDLKARPWIRSRAKTKAELDSNMQAWSSSQVWEFHEKLERTPSNHKELADLCRMRLEDLKNDLEEGDSSIAGILRKVVEEREIRIYVGKELREKSFGRYSVPQEEELADAKRMDIRLHGVGFDAPVPIELKLADNWTGPDLFERLKNQLCGDYLRDSRSKRGAYLLMYRGERFSWKIPTDGTSENFTGLIEALKGYWQQISHEYPGIDEIAVIGIDLTKRSKH